jgi:hypothetical protein
MNRNSRLLSRILARIFLLPKIDTEKVYSGLLRMLMINTLYLILLFGISNRVFETTLAFDLFNAIALILIILNCMACKLNYRKPKEIIAFIVVGIIAINLVTSSVALNIDRSRSFYVLSWADKKLINYRGGNLDLGMVKSTEKLNLPAIELRIIEQQERGLIEISESKAELTYRGKILIQISGVIAEILALRNWKTNNF